MLEPMRKIPLKVEAFFINMLDDIQKDMYYEILTNTQNITMFAVPESINTDYVSAQRMLPFMMGLPPIVVKYRITYTNGDKQDQTICIDHNSKYTYAYIDMDLAIKQIENTKDRFCINPTTIQLRLVINPTTKELITKAYIF